MEQLIPYDSADYLKTPEDVKDYLAGSCQWNDPRQIAQALGTAARAQSTNMAELARTIGVSRESLYRSFTREGNPSLATAMRLANALGYTFTLVPIEAVPDTVDGETIVRRMNEEMTNGSGSK